MENELRISRLKSQDISRKLRGYADQSRTRLRCITFQLQYPYTILFLEILNFLLRTVTLTILFLRSTVAIQPNVRYALFVF